MAALSEEIDTVKFVHTDGAGLHSGDADPDEYDPRWQRRQVDDFVDFAVLAEELGFDGMTVTEHHAPLMTCPVAEEAGMLDLLSGGRFELGLGRGIPGEAQIAAGGNLSVEDLKQAWLEGLEVVNLALTERDFTFGGNFYPVVHADHSAARKNRPAIAVPGTPAQIADALQQVIDETGARRLPIETFSREEARLFAREVIPALKERNATAV